MKNQSGRSMVEMLGVLAIIGVLSAGALKGYSAAMFRHKMNQTIDIFNGVLQRFVELEQKGWGKVEINGAEDLIKYGLLPDCQVIEEDFCKLPIGNLTMGFYDNGSYVYGEFVIRFTDSKSCIAFSSAGWENAVPVEWWYRPEREDEGGRISINDSVAIYNLNSSQLDIIDTVTMQNISEACKSCDIGACDWELVVRSYI